jgi:hypothetical protein
LVGSSCDNALAETANGLYKTELMEPAKPWRTIDDVELATADWGFTGSATAALRVQQRHALNTGDQPLAELSCQTVSGLTGGSEPQTDRVQAVLCLAASRIPLGSSGLWSSMHDHSDRVGSPSQTA